jgi:hypothetical protein
MVPRAIELAKGKVTAMKNATRTIRKETTARIEWSEVDEVTLVRHVLDRSNFVLSNAAWRELMRRYQHLVEERIEHTLLSACRLLLSRELREEIRAEFLVRLLEDDMAQLRKFNPKQWSLGEWLTSLGHRAAIGHFARCLTHSDAIAPEIVSIKRVAEVCDLEGGERQFTDVRQAGARWLARGL